MTPSKDDEPLECIDIHGHPWKSKNTHVQVSTPLDIVPPPLDPAPTPLDLVPAPLDPVPAPDLVPTAQDLIPTPLYHEALIQPQSLPLLDSMCWGACCLPSPRAK